MTNDTNKSSVSPEAAGTGVMTIVRLITAARWNKAETAFYKNVEITRQGTVKNLRGGILAAVKELMS